MDVMGVCDRSGVPTVAKLEVSGLLLCFVACLLVDHGRSLLAFCITKDCAFRRPWREPLADLEASTKRKSCWTGMAGGALLCFPFARLSLWLAIMLPHAGQRDRLPCCFTEGERLRSSQGISYNRDEIVKKVRQIFPIPFFIAVIWFRVEVGDFSSVADIRPRF